MRVVEVGGHGDDGLVDRGPKVRLSVPLELLERASRDLLCGVFLVVDVLGPASAHVTLHRTDGAPGVGDGLTFGHLADQDLSVFGEGHYRRGGAGTLGVGDNYREVGATKVVDAALDHESVRLLVNALGPPPSFMIEKARSAGCFVGALAGAKEHAIKHAEVGVDLLIVSGTEAGGHCGEVSTLVLVPEDRVASRPR